MVSVKQMSVYRRYPKSKIGAVSQHVSVYSALAPFFRQKSGIGNKIKLKKFWILHLRQPFFLETWSHTRRNFLCHLLPLNLSAPRQINRIMFSLLWRSSSSSRKKTFLQFGYYLSQAIFSRRPWYFNCHFGYENAFRANTVWLKRFANRPSGCRMLRGNGGWREGILRPWPPMGMRWIL